MPDNVLNALSLEAQSQIKPGSCPEAMYRHLKSSVQDVTEG